MLYGYTDVDGLGASVAPPAPHCFASLDEARSKFEAEARKHFVISGQPLIMRLFAGSPDGDETRYGYPDEPDHTLRAQGNDFNLDILIEEF